MLIGGGCEPLLAAQCRILLEGVAVGRVAVTVAGLPVIAPVDFALVDEDVVFRVEAEGPLHSATDGAVVAFEADGCRTDARTGWIVLAIGRADTISDAEERDAVTRRHGVPLLFDGREALVRLRPEMLAGRRLAFTD